MSKCKSCGAKLDEKDLSSKFCPYCGAEIEKEKVEKVEQTDVQNTEVANEDSTSTEKQPLYYDPATGQPVYDNGATTGADMLGSAMSSAYSSNTTKAREEFKKSEKRKLGITAIILSLVGLAAFGLGYIISVSMFADVNDVGKIILYLFGFFLIPLITLGASSILLIIGFVFGLVGVCKAPKLVVSWIGFIISVIALIAGAILLISYGATVFPSGD